MRKKYVDNPSNRRLGRVGKLYGKKEKIPKEKKKKTPPKKKPSSKKNVLKKTKSQKIDIDFKSSLPSIGKLINPNQNITYAAKIQLNKFINNFIKKFCKVSDRKGFVNFANDESVKTIFEALLLTPELANLAIKNANKAIDIYLAGNKKAGLSLSIPKMKKVMKTTSDKDAVYLAAIIEYLLVEILGVAGNTARDHGHSAITPEYINLAIKNDVELKKLFNKLE